MGRSCGAAAQRLDKGGGLRLFTHMGPPPWLPLFPGGCLPGWGGHKLPPRMLMWGGSDGNLGRKEGALRSRVPFVPKLFGVFGAPLLHLGCAAPCPVPTSSTPPALFCAPPVRLLVGAPQDVDPQNITRTGAVYACPLSDSTDDCQRLDIELKSA